MSELRLGLTAEDKASPVVQKFLQQLNALQPTAEQVNNELRKLGFTVDDTGKVFNQAGQAIGDKAATALRNLATGGDVSTRSLQRLGDQVVRGTQNFKDAEQGSKGFLDSLLGGAGNALKFGAAVVGIGTGVGALTSVFRDAISHVADFEAQMANVNTLGIRSVAVQDQLREQILKLPPVLGSSTELAKGLYEALSSGVEPAKAVAFVEEAAKLAKAGLADLDVTVNTLTKTMAAFKIPTEDVGQVADVLFKTVEIGQGSLQQFAQALPQVTNLAAQLGVSFVDTNAALATLSQTFRSPEAAATGLRSLLTQLIQNADKFAAVGVNVQQVIGEQGLTGILRVLQQITGNNSERMRVFVNDVEGLSAAAALTGPQFKSLQDNIKQYNESVGTVGRNVQVQSQTAKAAWTEFTNELGRLADEAAPKILRFFTITAKGATSLAKDTGDALDFLKGKFKDAGLAIPEQETKGLQIIRDTLGLIGISVPKIDAAGQSVKQLEQEMQGLTGTASDFGRTDIGGVLGEVGKAFTITTAAGTTLNDALIKSRNDATEASKAYQQLQTDLKAINTNLKDLKVGETIQLFDPKEVQTRIDATLAAFQRLSTNSQVNVRELQAAIETFAVTVRERLGTVPPALQALLENIRALGSTDSLGALERLGLKSKAVLQDGLLKELQDVQTAFASKDFVPAALLQKIASIADEFHKAGVRIPDDYRQLLLKELPQIVEQASKEAIARGERLPKGMTELMTKTQEELRKGGAALLPIAQTTGEDLAAKFVGGFSNLPDKLGAQVVAVRNQLQALKTAELTNLGTVQQEAVEQTAKVVEEAQKKYGATTEALKGELAKQREALKGSLADIIGQVEKIGDGVQKNLHITLTNAGAVAEADGEGVGKRLAGGFSKGIVNVDAQLDVMREKLAKSTKVLDDALSGLMDTNQTLFRGLGAPALKYSEVFDAIIQAQTKFGANYIEHLSDLQKKAALQYGLLTQDALEGGEAMAEGLTEGARKAKEGVIEQLSEAEKFARQNAHDLAVVFQEAFPDTITGLTARLQQAQKELLNIQSGPEPIGTTGFKAFTTQKLNEEIEILTKKLKDLQGQDKTTKDQLATPVKVPSSGLASTVIGGHTPTTPTAGTGAMGAGGLSLAPPSTPSFVTGLAPELIRPTPPAPALGAPVTGTLQPGDTTSIAISLQAREREREQALITGTPRAPFVTGAPLSAMTRTHAQPVTGGGPGSTVVHQTVNFTMQSTFAPSTPHLHAAVKQILPLLRDASGRGQLTPAQPGR